jgi:hypothetical protein
VNKRRLKKAHKKLEEETQRTIERAFDALEGKSGQHEKRRWPRLTARERRAVNKSQGP